MVGLDLGAPAPFEGDGEGFSIEDVRTLVRFCLLPESNAHKWFKIRDGSRPVLEATKRLANAFGISEDWRDGDEPPV